jgi:hypothetical protein
MPDSSISHTEESDPNQEIPVVTKNSTNLDKGKGRAEEWVDEQVKTLDPRAKDFNSPSVSRQAALSMPGETLVRETTRAWVDPKALARLIRAQASTTVEDAQTRSGEDDLLLFPAEQVEPAQFVREALEQVTKEMGEVQAIAKSQGSKITPVVRKGFERMAHQGTLVDQPGILPGISSESALHYPEDGDINRGSDDHDQGQDKDYQSSIVESVRKDFSDFKEATESFLGKIDKSLKQIDARLRALEGIPTPVREQGEIVSHRRILSSEASPRPVAVYTPTSGASMVSSQAVDTLFILKTRHTLSPAVQHSIFTKNIGTQIADSLKLPVPKEKWTPSGLAQLISEIPT